jgi:hypothetical protein
VTALSATHGRRGAYTPPRHLTVSRILSRGSSLSIISAAPASVALSMLAGSRVALRISTATSGEELAQQLSTVFLPYQPPLSFE